MELAHLTSVSKTGPGRWHCSCSCGWSEDFIGKLLTDARHLCWKHWAAFPPA